MRQSAPSPDTSAIPGPSSRLPWVGVGLSYSQDPIQFLTDTARTHGDIAAFKLAGMQCVLLSDGPSIQQVLVRNHDRYRKGPVLESITEALGQGLLTAEGETWRVHRKNAQPAFHRTALERYPQEIRTLTARMLSAWKPGDTRLALEEMLKLTLDIAVKCFFDASLESRARELGESFSEITDFFEYTLTPSGRLSLKLPTLRRKNYLRAVRILDRTLSDIIHPRLERKDPGQDLLGQLIQAQLTTKGAVHYDSLRDDLMTIFIAGHETSATALAFTLYLLAREPHLQSRIRAPGADPNLLKHSILESLRLYPPVWTLGRESLVEDQLHGYTISPRTLILIPVWAIHRDPRNFEAPEEFRPERWAARPRETLNPGAYLPFGMGRRACIGENFALLQLELILSAILDRFEVAVENPETPRLTGTLTLRPREDFRLTLREIQA